MVGGTLGLAACTSSSSDNSGKGSATPSGTSSETQSQEDAAAAENASAAKIAITPKAGASNASINLGTKVSVTGGTLTSVSMVVKATGDKVAGTISADKTSWTPDGQLDRGTQYENTAAATDTKGKSVSENSTFSTVSASNSFLGYFTPDDGDSVGVGMPVSINFDKAVSSGNRAAVEKAITVTSSSGQEVVGHWYSSTRLDLRPEAYWEAGSKVTLALKLDGVEGSSGVYGIQEKSITFDVGRSQVSTVDAKTKEMKVVRDGTLLKTIPISAGSPEHTTYNGQMVISEKDKTTRMDGATVGFTDSDGKGEYDIPDVPHAMRLSTSGTFIHGNYWGDPSVFGNVNTSHGCVGLEDKKGANDPNTPAAWFYANSLIGDVVIVKNSNDKTIQPDNGLNGWNLSWSDWVAGSAVSS